MKYNTVNTKAAQLSNGYFSIEYGPEVILIVGSCRSVPYVNYLQEYNEANGEPYKICFLDPYNWNYDLNENRVDMESVITALETDERLLNMLSSVSICIHEFYKNFGMFNFDRTSGKNIYQFGLSPKLDICIPSLNDKFILFGDILAFDLDLRKKAIADMNVSGRLSPQTFYEIKAKSNSETMKFLEVCKKSDIPEMGELYNREYQKKRFFFNFNHVTKAYTLAMLDFMNDKFLRLDLSSVNRAHPDMYANNYTHLCQEDIDAFGYEWENDDLVSLKSKLFF